MAAAPAPVDWEVLRRAAAEAARHAHAPYSRFRVGAAGLTETGAVVVGCNVENVSYGLSLCAECVLVGNLHLHDGGRLVAVATVRGDGRPVMPCGRCRQLLHEAGGGELLVDGDGTPRPLADLLPSAFDTADLDAGRDQ